MSEPTGPWLVLKTGGRTLAIRPERIDWTVTTPSGLVTLHVNGAEIQLTATESDEYRKAMTPTASERLAAIVQGGRPRLAGSSAADARGPHVRSMPQSTPPTAT